MLLYTIPTTLVPIGAGQITSGLLDPALISLVFTVTQSGWPLTGGTAFDWTALQSSDGGASWRTLAGCGVADIAFQDGKCALSCDIRDVGNERRIVRLAWVAHKALTVSATLEGF